MTDKIINLSTKSTIIHDSANEQNLIVDESKESCQYFDKDVEVVDLSNKINSIEKESFKINVHSQEFEVIFVYNLSLNFIGYDVETYTGTKFLFIPSSKKLSSALIQLVISAKLEKSELTERDIAEILSTGRWIKNSSQEVQCDIFNDEWNQFTKEWFTKIYSFLEEKLGKFLGKLSYKIIALPKEDIDVHINAKYSPATGDIWLREESQGNIPYLLGNLLHELTHANLGDTYVEYFFSEGFADYVDEILCEDPFWEKLREIMRDGFIASNKQRGINAVERPTELNIGRWKGQQWARENLGDTIIEGIREAKREYTTRGLRSSLDIISENEITIPSRFSSIVDKIKTVANNEGLTAYIVGGFVRDLLLGREPNDLDIMVEGKEQAGIVLAEALATEYKLHKPVIFSRFGTAMLNIDNEKVEFVQPRKEYYTEESRKPETEKGSIEQDALRRDFSINALFYRINDGEILDLTGHGLKDLKEKKIKVTDEENADVIFHQDPLRMLRAIRQSLQLGFEIDEKTKEAIKRNADRLQIISKERINEELSKILMTVKPSDGIRFLKDTGLLKYVLPELEQTIGQEQPTKWHSKDVFEHIMSVLDSVPQDLVLRLSALLHDIGKPATKQIVEDTIHFFEHERVGADMARDILKRLKFPSEVADQVTFNISQHMRPHGAEEWSDAAVRRFVREMGEHLEKILTLAEADVTSGRPEKVQKVKEDIQTLRQRIDDLQKQQEIQKIPELLTGNELMELFNLGPGRWIKLIKEYLLTEQDKNPNITKDEAIELTKKFVESNPDIMKNSSLDKIRERVRERKLKYLNWSPSGRMRSNDPTSSPKELGEGQSGGAFPSVSWQPAGQESKDVKLP